MNLRADVSQWLHRALLWGLIISILIGVGIGVWNVIFALDISWSQERQRILFCGLLIPVNLGAMLAALSVGRRQRYLVLPMILSVLLTAAGTWCLVESLRWEFQGPSNFPNREMLLQAGGIGLCLGLALAHCAVFGVFVKARTRLLIGAKLAVMSAVCLFALGICAMIVIAFMGRLGMTGFLFITPIMPLLGLCSLVGTIALPVAALSQANKRELPAESVHSKAKLFFGCPKCQHRQELAPGAARCAKCGLGLLIEIEEPRCACGYLLYRLKRATCPECGREIQNPMHDAAVASHA